MAHRLLKRQCKANANVMYIYSGEIACGKSLAAKPLVANHLQRSCLWQIACGEAACSGIAYSENPTEPIASIPITLRYVI